MKRLILANVLTGKVIFYNPEVISEDIKSLPYDKDRVSLITLNNDYKKEVVSKLKETRIERTFKGIFAKKNSFKDFDKFYNNQSKNQLGKFFEDVISFFLIKDQLKKVENINNYIKEEFKDLGISLLNYFKEDFNTKLYFNLYDTFETRASFKNLLINYVILGKISSPSFDIHFHSSTKNHHGIFSIINQYKEFINQNYEALEKVCKKLINVLKGNNLNLEGLPNLKLISNNTRAIIDFCSQDFILDVKCYEEKNIDNNKNILQLIYYYKIVKDVLK